MNSPTDTDDPASPPAGAAWLRAVHSTDIDEHADAQAQWSLHYEQLSSGRFAGDLVHVQLPGVRLVHETASCATRQRGHIGQGHYGFAMALDLPGEAIFNGQRLDRDSLMIGRSEELDLSTPAGFSLIGLVVDGELLNALWERMYQKRLSAWLEQQLVVQVQRPLGYALRTTHIDLLGRIAGAPGLLNDPTAVLQMRDAILIDWIEAIPPRVDTTRLKTVGARKRVVQRACDLMLERPDQPISILQLCSQIGASPSKLEYCFRDILGITPAKYLRALRMNGVRRELKGETSADRAVQDIAAHWGFWHLGEFAADYKRQFGELPSATLRRGRDKAQAQ
jgi:AraC family transcriptional regulator, ethanolamine operon transcriptional activator